MTILHVFYINKTFYSSMHSIGGWVYTCHNNTTWVIQIILNMCILKALIHVSYSSMFWHKVLVTHCSSTLVEYRVLVPTLSLWLPDSHLVRDSLFHQPTLLCVLHIRGWLKINNITCDITPTTSQHITHNITHNITHDT